MDSINGSRFIHLRSYSVSGRYFCLVSVCREFVCVSCNCVCVVYVLVCFKFV